MGLRLSGWTYDTGATGGAGLGFAAASGGHIWLKDPAGKSNSFWYGGIGVGLSLFRIPHIPEPKIKGLGIGGAGSTKKFRSYGTIYMSPFFRGRELSRSDFFGGTLFIDGGGGLIVGWSGTALIVGMNPLLMAAGSSNPEFMSRAIEGSSAIILMTGMNVGLQAGAGVAALEGYLR